LDARGARPTKETKNSTRHIDLGVCAVAGLDRAVFNANAAPPLDVVAQIF